MKQQIDTSWDFRGEATTEYTHGLHTYPARMVPQIARRIIAEHGAAGGYLLDPYCGSGTSLVEARVSGMNGYGIDINPAARAISRAKTAYYDIKSLVNYTRYIQQYDIDRESRAIQCEVLEDYETLIKWFPCKTIREIAHMISIIDGIDCERTKLFMQISLSECLRSVSYQRNNEFKLYRIEECKRPSHYIYLADILSKVLERNLQSVIRFQDAARAESIVDVLDINTVNTCPLDHLGRQVDMVLTSPPYGDSATTVAYAQFSWMTNRWIFKDSRPAGALDRLMMGGAKCETAVFGVDALDSAISLVADRDNNRAQEVSHFYLEYKKSISNVSQCVKSGGVVCYVVGNRTVKGISLPTDIFTVEEFKANGFFHLDTIVRNIPNKRMPAVNSPSNISGKTSPTMTNEYIVIMRKY